MLSAGLQRGFSLIEALVALVVLLAGLAGGATLLLQTLHHERESAWRRTALRHASSLAEELRALRGDAGAPVPAESGVIADWSASVRAALPDGALGSVIDGADGELHILVSWPAANGRQQLRLPVLP